MEEGWKGVFRNVCVALALNELNEGLRCGWGWRVLIEGIIIYHSHTLPDTSYPAKYLLGHEER